MPRRTEHRCIACGETSDCMGTGVLAHAAVRFNLRDPNRYLASADSRRQHGPEYSRCHLRGMPGQLGSWIHWTRLRRTSTNVGHGPARHLRCDGLPKAFDLLPHAIRGRPAERRT